MPDPRADIRALIDRRGPARAPDFFCIGSEKCGTTWLWEMLRDHPDVGVPLPKELRYFASIHIGTGLSNFNALRRLLTNHAKTRGGGNSWKSWPPNCASASAATKPICASSGPCPSAWWAKSRRNTARFPTRGSPTCAWSPRMPGSSC